VNEEDSARLSPARYEHNNPYGKYRFEVEERLSRTRLRPLRPPTEHRSLCRSLFFSPLLSEPRDRLGAHLVSYVPRCGRANQAA
jgi:hypothetical protein